jgi:hypothetical protein
MAQHFSDPRRASDPHALPDIEVFHAEAGTLFTEDDPNAEPHEAGWFWQSCFPGCLPDGDPTGPFATEREALDDAQSDSEPLDDINTLIDAQEDQ